MKKMVDKKGLSEVVTTVLLVLLALGAILLVWFLVRGQITRGISQVNVQRACIDVEFEATECALTDTGLPVGVDTVTVNYKRGSQELSEGLVFSKAKIVLEKDDGTSIVKDIAGTDIPAILETKSILYNIATDLNGETPVKVGVAAVFSTTEGEESACPESTKVVCIA